MTRRPSTFRQRDVTRALKAARAAGIDVGRFEVDKAGKIIVVAKTDDERTGKAINGNPWDEVLGHDGH
jgi:hypothetical protein